MTFKQLNTKKRLIMSNVHNLMDDMALACECGCVGFNYLKSHKLECEKCGKKIDLISNAPTIAREGWKGLDNSEISRIFYQTESMDRVGLIKTVANVLKARNSPTDKE